MASLVLLMSPNKSAGFLSVLARFMVTTDVPEAEGREVPRIPARTANALLAHKETYFASSAFQRWSR